MIGGVEHEVLRTTPEAIDLQAGFREMLDGGDRACVMEVSSHALELHRADAIHFAAAIFTNLTQDHLDFHDTMDAYYAAKRMLFADLRPPASIVNVDDPYGQARGRARRSADVRAPRSRRLPGDRRQHGPGRLDAHRRDARRGDALKSPLRGEFNVYNVLGALAAARALGVSAETCVEAIATAGQVPGRFETVDDGQPFAVLVDYAHTPDSLENVLRAARELAERRVIVVFGCGGDRDRGKRPLMGEIAGRLADLAIVTSDNPRSEDPEAIIAEILAGSACGHDLRGRSPARRSRTRSRPPSPATWS